MRPFSQRLCESFSHLMRTSFITLDFGAMKSARHVSGWRSGS